MSGAMRRDDGEGMVAMTQTVPTQVLVLGPVRFVAADGMDVKVSPRKGALLARLAIDVGRVARV